MIKKKNKFRIPIALHIYSSLIMITLITVFVIGILSTYIIRNYIATECEKRIISAATSCQQFSNAFRTGLPEEELDTQNLTNEEIRDSLLNAIVSSTDLSSEASMALINMEYVNNDFNLLWPEEFHSISTYNNTNGTKNNNPE